MHIELQDIFSGISVFCILFVKVAINTFIGYLIAFLIFAAAMPRQCRRWSSVLNVIREAYSIKALKDLSVQVRTLRSWRNEVGIWTFFTIGAPSLLSFSERNPGVFFSALGLTVFGSLFLVLQWERNAESPPVSAPIDNVEKNAESGPGE